MIYVPIMKNRKAEIQAAKRSVECFCEMIIPYFEIIDEKYEIRYQIDSKGKRVLELKEGNKNRTPIKLPPTSDDICTLERLIEATGDNPCFIEYFRYSTEDYPDSKIDLSKVTLARDLSSNYEKYAERTIGICEFDNLIPVISIKKSFRVSESDLQELINKIREKRKPCGIRIQLVLFDDYQSFLEDALTENDYMFVDIGETSYRSQEFLLQDIADSSIRARLILFNSPRHKGDAKKYFQLDGWEPLINNEVAEKYSDCQFDGFGDYAGLKDALPEDVPVRSYVLALLYDKDRNEFWSIRSQEKGDAKEVKQKALEHASTMNLDGNCKAFREIKRINSGTQSTWNTITLIRYIDQIYHKIIK